MAAFALSWCRVFEDRWVLPHHSVRASFGVGRWSAQICKSVRFPVVWPAAWVSAVNKSRGSKSSEVRRIWEVYDECLQVVQPGFREGVRSALSSGDVSLAWSVWSYSAEVSLVHVPVFLLVDPCLLTVFVVVVVLPDSRRS